MRTSRSTVGMFVIGGLLVALGLAVFASPYASSSPDGLERVAIDRGFAEAASDHALADSPLADYGVRGIDDPRLSTGLSGLVGVLITFGIALVLFGLLRRSRELGRGGPSSRDGASASAPGASAPA
jgi:hypothetical protein